MNSTNDPSFYEVYKDAGFPASFVAICAVRFILAVLGILFNGALIYITICSKRLRNRCNALLAFDAACAGVAFLCNVILFFIVISMRFIPLRTCFWLQLIPAIFINLLLNAMLSVGIDRLISVVAPIWIGHQNPRLYVGSLIFACLIYAIYAIIRLYPASLIETPNMPVMCVLNDLYQGLVGLELFRNCMIFTGLTILCYVAIWVVIRLKKAQQTNAKRQLDYTKKIFKSLVVNVTFVSIGYFLNAGFLILLTKIQWTQIQIVYGVHILAIFTSLAGISNAPALYIFSTDYRRAFNEVIRGDKIQSQIANSMAIGANKSGQIVPIRSTRSPPAHAWATNVG